MAIGDEAREQGFPLVPDSGEDGKLKWGAREINKTRDYAARALSRILQVWPVNRGGTGGVTPTEARNNLGISTGADHPTGGNAGDIYFKVL